jgi:NADH-quinone oxidoreductase subunit E
MELKSETLEKINKLIPRYPEKRSLVLPILHLIQKERGYICDSAMEWVADKLDLQPMAILEVLTFYPMFRRKPIGKIHIKVCRTLPCALNGAYSVCAQLQEKLRCKLGETSEDGKFTIDFVECIANCGTGPVVQVDETMYENITPDSVNGLVTKLKKIASAKLKDA